jgi:hypothetical protein
VEPVTHALDAFEFTTSEGIFEDSTSIEDLLSNCDDYEDREIKVPRVVE